MSVSARQSHRYELVSERVFQHVWVSDLHRCEDRLASGDSSALLRGEFKEKREEKLIENRQIADVLQELFFFYQDGHLATSQQSRLVSSLLFSQIRSEEQMRSSG